MSYRDYQEDGLSDYFREIRSSKCNPLSLEEELEIGKRSFEGDEKAKEELIKHNLRFVVKVAKRFTGYGLSLQDLIEEGNIGLMQAIDRYDYRKGYKLISYAVWWIKQSIRRALDNTSKSIRLSSHTYEQLSKIEKWRKRGYTDSEIEEAGISQKRILELNNLPESTSFNNAKKGKRTIEQDYPDETYSPETTNDLIREKVISVMDKGLDKRSAEILKLKYGFTEGEHTIEEIGMIYDITGTRVTQINKGSLQKLKDKIKCASF